MKFRNRAITALAILLASTIWFATRAKKEPAPRPIAPQEVSSPPANVAPVETSATAPVPLPQNQAAVPSKGNEVSRATSQLGMVNPLLPPDPLAKPPRRVSDVEPDAAPDFEKIALMLRDYRTLFGENPEGTNAEIMQAIMGGNPRAAKLGPPEGQSLNENGELIDRWGSPYFFHQLTKDLMEIRSAGPDRRMWNEDDLIGD